MQLPVLYHRTPLCLDYKRYHQFNTCCGLQICTVCNFSKITETFCSSSWNMEKEFSLILLMFECCGVILAKLVAQSCLQPQDGWQINLNSIKYQYLPVPGKDLIGGQRCHIQSEHLADYLTNNNNNKLLVYSKNS